MVPGRRYNLRYAQRVLRQCWWMILLPLFILGSLCTLVAKALPNVYYTQTAVMIVPQRIPESYVRSTVTVSLAERLHSTREQVLSREQIEEVIKRFDLFPTVRDRVPKEALILWVRRSVRIELVSPTMFVVGYAGYDPKRVHMLAEHFAGLVLRESRREREMLADNTSQFLEAELTAARDRLQTHEARVEEYRRKYAGELPSQLEANLRILQGTSAQLQAVMEGLQRDRVRREELANQLSTATADTEGGGETSGTDVPGTANDPNATTQPPSVQLQAVRAARQKLLLRLTPEHPDVQTLDRTIEVLEKAAAAAPRLVAGTPAPARRGRAAQLREALRAIDEQIAAKQTIETRLRDTVEKYQARVEGVPEREAEWVQLTRDYNTLQGVYGSLLAKREESRIAANLERQQVGEQFRIVDRPIVPARPISPNRPAIVFMGLAIGFGIGLGFVVLRELRDRSFRAEEEITEALRLPVVGLVPVITTALDRRRIRRRRMIWSAAALLVFASAAALRWIR